MKILIYIFFALVIAGIVFSILKYKAAHVKDQGDLVASVDQEVRKLNADQKNFVVSIGIFKAEHAYFQSFGELSSNDSGSTSIELSSESLFQIGSLTKLFTSSVFMALVEKGIVRENLKISEVLDSSYKVSEKVKDITLRQLATHTSGFPKVPKALLDKVEAANPKQPLLDPYTHISLKDVLNYLANPSDTKTAGNFEYSNYGMGLLAHLMEIITGKSFGALVSEYVTSPLDMNETEMRFRPDQNKNLVPGFDGEGKPASVWTFNALEGAGGLYSSTRDMMKFIKANLEGKLSFLSKMQKVENGSAVGWMLPTQIDNFFGNEDILWHNGQVGAYSSYLAINLKNKFGIVILTNKSIDLTMLGIMLTRQVRTQSWKKD